MGRLFVVSVMVVMMALGNHLQAQEPIVVIAEGEAFTPKGKDGWVLTVQDDSLASHTYGGMWVTHGALLGAPADSDGAVAEQVVTIPSGGEFRVWSKYQAPPYFNYLHKIEIEQAGRVVYSEIYGKDGTPRLWSFSEQSDQLWFFWGVDHDAAESPEKVVRLAEGEATIRLITVKNPAPAGPRMVDFVVLTTNPEADYIGRKPYKVATPFANEALAATPLYMRFRNSTDKPAKLTASTKEHFQPSYGGKKVEYPAEPVAAGQWSEWVHVGPQLRLVHNEALTPSLPGAAVIEVEFARDPAGTNSAGSVKAAPGDQIFIPIDIVWNTKSTVTTTRALGTALIAKAKAWPKANGGKKPQKFLFYGAFRGPDWVPAMKDALGYNTVLPDTFEHVAIDGYHQHAGNAAAIKKLAASVPDVKKHKIVSFGDEIHFPAMKPATYEDPAIQAEFAAWIAARGLTEKQLGMKPADAAFAKAQTDPHLAWYATIFWEERTFEHFKALTELAKQEFGPQVLTGANYSPHSPPQYYGPIGQWVDVFRHDGMSMYWSEDYVFSVPEPPQIESWHFAMMHAAVRYNHQPIHYYVMPHAPGQPADILRRCMIYAAGNGATSIDSFWMGPQEQFTENYVAWQYEDSFKAIHDTIYQTAEVEDILIGGTHRSTRIALVISKATQVNEDKLMFDKKDDAFTARSANADQGYHARFLKQVMCRKEQQALFLALHRAQYDVDLITEDDIYDRQALANYDVVYFAGEWVDTQIILPLEAWVQAGGTLYVSAGLGHLNQFGETDDGMLGILGLKRTPITKQLYNVRPLLELPLAETLDTITMGDQTVAMIGWQQRLQPSTAEVIGTWADGSAAVTRRTLGKGQAIAVGGLPGLSWQKTGLRVVPFARGGRLNLYHPDGFADGATALATLGIAGRELPRSVVCSIPGVEGTVVDNATGSVLTLVAWTNEPANGLTVQVVMPKKPTKVYSVTTGKDVAFTYADGVATLSLDLPDADYIVLK